MSQRGCWTTTHADSGGMCAWVHINSGKKLWWMWPPTADNVLRHHEALSAEKGENGLEARFLLEDTGDAICFTLEAGDTIIMPPGWLHAVYTCEDTIAWSGDFAHLSTIDLSVRALRNEIRREVSSNDAGKKQKTHSGRAELPLRSLAAMVDSREHRRADHASSVCAATQRSRNRSAAIR